MGTHAGNDSSLIMIWARVQVGTDKTPAELAPVCLEKDITAVNAQWQAASLDFSRIAA